MKFYLNGSTYDTDKFQIETWKGRHKDDFYDYETILPELFFTRMIEAAKEDGKKEVRSGILKSLGIKI